MTCRNGGGEEYSSKNELNSSTFRVRVSRKPQKLINQEIVQV